MKDFRYKDMLQTFELVKPEIQVLESYISEDLAEPILYLIKDKFQSNPPIRSYFVRKIFEYLVGHKWNEKVIKIAFLSEILITLMYHENHILDGKYDTKEHASINLELLASIIMKDLLFKYVNHSFDDKEQTTIRMAVDSILFYRNIGEFINKSLTTYDNYLANKSFSLPQEILTTTNVDSFIAILDNANQFLPNKQDFIKLYFTKIYLINANLFEIFTKLLLELYCPTHHEKDSIIEFSRFYGMVIQSVNDNVDFVPSSFGQRTVAKKINDAFRDLENKNITLPLMIYLKNPLPDSNILKYLQTGIHSYIYDNEQQITMELLKTNSLYDAIEITKKFARAAAKLISKDNECAKYLLDGLSIAWKNRYYDKYKTMSKKDLNG